MTSEEIRNVTDNTPANFWLQQIAYQLAVQNERNGCQNCAGVPTEHDSGIRCHVCQRPLTPAVLTEPRASLEGRTGPEYQIRDVLDGLSRIENIVAASRRSFPTPATMERIREVVERIRALELGKRDAVSDAPARYGDLQYDLDMLRGEYERVRSERDDACRERDLARASIRRTLDWAVLENRVRLQRAGLAPVLRSCVQTISENAMSGFQAIEYLNKYADTVERAESANGAEGVNKKEAPGG